MTPRTLSLFAVALCAQFAAAEGPPAFDPRPPIGFKDITPPPMLPSAPVEKEKETPPGHAEAPAHPEAADGGLFATAEYLLMRPRRSAFDFAITDTNRDLVPNGTLRSLNYEQRSGVRIGLGYRLGDSYWDTKFEYTYFGSGASGSAVAPAGGTLYATLTRAGLNDEATSALATASLTYNVFDFVAGRRVILDENTAIRFVGGFRFAAIRQSFTGAYNGGDANFGQVNTATNFDGFGPLFGGEIIWQVRGGFHFYARGSAALVAGSLHNPYSETNNAGRTLYASLDPAARRVVPVASLGIGGGWERDRFSFRVGYEVTNWFNLIESPRFTGELAEGKFTTRTSDFSLEGIFAQIGIAF